MLEDQHSPTSLLACHHQVLSHYDPIVSVKSNLPKIIASQARHPSYRSHIRDRMSPTKVICQIRVQQSESHDSDHQSQHEAVLLPLCDCGDVSIETRKKWTVGVMERIGGGSEHNSIRPWNLVAKSDGSVESLATPASEKDLSEGYPARFQIPHGPLDGLETREKVTRAEKFAMASLLYEIMTGKKPFEELSDSELQNRFTRGDFPDDAAFLPSSLFILSGWSKEFELEIAKISM